MQNDMRDGLINLLNIAVGDSDLNDNELKIVADYLIANGVILPHCKVGETVYCIVFLPVGCKLSVEKGFVREFRITEEKVCVNIVDCEYIKFANLNINVSYDDFGKTVFFTKEQAEQKLKEMRVENDL